MRGFVILVADSMNKKLLQLVTLLFLAGICFGAGRWTGLASIQQPLGHGQLIMEKENLAYPVMPDASAPISSQGNSSPSGPWIDVVPEAEAEGLLLQMYKQLNEGYDNNLARIHSLYPETLQGHAQLYAMLLKKPTESLTEGDRHQIALAVSSANRSRYCQTHHSLLFQVNRPKALRYKELCDLVRRRTDREKAMINYAEKLTKSPFEMTYGHIRDLREVGFTDRDILEINLLTGYMNFINRIALGLGLQLEPYWEVHPDH